MKKMTNLKLRASRHRLGITGLLVLCLALFAGCTVDPAPVTTQEQAVMDMPTDMNCDCVGPQLCCTSSINDTPICSPSAQCSCTANGCTWSYNPRTRTYTCDCGGVFGPSGSTGDDLTAAAQSELQSTLQEHGINLDDSEARLRAWCNSRYDYSMCCMDVGACYVCGFCDSSGCEGNISGDWAGC